MDRRYRLTRSEDFKRVRHIGKSYAHPLVVMFTAGSEREGVRIGVTAGRMVGSAIYRNRAKRLLRAAAASLVPKIHSGNDILLIARSSLVAASCEQTQMALKTLLTRSGLLDDNGG